MIWLSAQEFMRKCRGDTYAIPPYPIAAPDSASLRCLKACIAVSFTNGTVTAKTLTLRYFVRS